MIYFRGPPLAQSWRCSYKKNTILEAAGLDSRSGWKMSRLPWAYSLRPILKTVWLWRLSIWLDRVTTSHESHDSQNRPVWLYLPHNNRGRWSHAQSKFNEPQKCFENIEENQKTLQIQGIEVYFKPLNEGSSEFDASFISKFCMALNAMRSHHF